MAKKTDKPARPLFGEVAASTGGRDITKGFADRLILRPEDTVLTGRGAGDFRIYEDVRRDDQVKSTFQQRRLAVVSREWIVEPGGEAAIDKQAAEALEQNLKALRWDDVTDKMLWGLFYGYAVAECIWALDGGRVVLADVKVRNRRRFRFDRDGRLRLVTTGNVDGEVMPPAKFWTFATGADHDDEPYGLGLAHWLYWPVFFKRHGLKYWLIFLEKFGAPTGVGKYPPSALPEDQDKLLAAVAAIQTDAGIIIPEGMMIELLEAKRSGSADQKAFYDTMDAAISKVVLSQTMTTDDGSSKSQASVHFDVRQEVVKADSDLVCGSFNWGPAAWLTAWNFPGAAPPRVWRRVEDDPDLKPQAERDEIIARMGFEPTQGYIDETYGEGFVKAKPKPPPAPFGRPARPGADPGDDPQDDSAFAERCPGCGARASPAAFAEGDDDSIDALVRAAIGDDGWEPVMEEMIAPIRRLVAESESFEEVRQGLAALFAEMDGERLTDLLARAGFATRLAGAVGAPVANDEVG